MKFNKTDKIPTKTECEELMAKYSMLPNIIEHSLQVMRVALAITDNLKDGVSINRDVVIAGALLHDITKTKALKKKEDHAATGGALLRELGFPRIAEIVEQHVILKNLNLEGKIEEKEIVNYADKRVSHDKIVTLEERVSDLMQRYGKTEEMRNHILQNMKTVIAVEHKLNSFMKVDINYAIKEIS
ncbi:MAG: HDIG domain-containing protein [Syntrophaceae bacterium]|nr:HDIG domain-containing protein [Syntrophaceae bacterium]